MNSFSQRFVPTELTHAGRDGGGQPLVMAIDNSGPGRSAKVRAWLREKQVVALFPRFAQNREILEGRAENAIAEIGVAAANCDGRATRPIGQLPSLRSGALGVIAARPERERKWELATARGVRSQSKFSPLIQRGGTLASRPAPAEIAGRTCSGSVSGCVDAQRAHAASHDERPHTPTRLTDSLRRPTIESEVLASITTHAPRSLEQRPSIQAAVLAAEPSARRSTSASEVGVTLGAIGSLILAAGLGADLTSEHVFPIALGPGQEDPVAQAELRLKSLGDPAHVRTSVELVAGGTVEWTTEIPCGVELAERVGDGWALIGTRAEFCPSIKEKAYCLDVWWLSGSGVPSRLDTVQFERFVEGPRSPRINRIQALNRTRFLLAVRDRRRSVRLPCDYELDRNGEAGFPWEGDQNAPSSPLPVGNEHWWIYDAASRAQPLDWSLSDTLPSEASQFRVLAVEPMAEGSLLAVHSLTRLRHDLPYPAKFGTRVDILDQNCMSIWHLSCPQIWDRDPNWTRPTEHGKSTLPKAALRKLSETQLEVRDDTGLVCFQIEIKRRDGPLWTIRADG